ncbi:MAG: hypothetical protein EPN38_01730 [Rhodanobacteraceae bacterium]|nr:MAG: hypothetical protein EPN38_01730 [Rhodanobacteraceae bacterium]
MSQSVPAPHANLVSPGTLVLCGMVAFTVIYRLLVHFAAGELPWNFTPIEAMALFGGAYFAKRHLAVIVPLVAMAGADALIALALPAAQIADWLRVAPVIYGCVALTAVAGFALRGRVRVWNTAVAAVGSATGFYLVTNFFTWATTVMYPHTLAGLGACYIAGWPFYQHGTLAGTLVWSALLFGGFALLGRRFTVLRLTTAH